MGLVAEHAIGVVGGGILGLAVAREQPQRREEALELADLFCQQARRRADRLFDELWANDDDTQYKAAQKVLEGRYQWFEHDVLDPAGDGPMIPSHEPSAKAQFAASDEVAAPDVEPQPTQ